MRSAADNFVDRILRDRQDRRILSGVILLLAAAVTIAVYWGLHYTGVAMTNEVYCGQEEHLHDEDCYTWELTCGLEESAGSEGHTHDDSCYETVTELVCGLEESEGHIHDESCFDEAGDLICAIPETEGHVHDNSCCETVRVLICGQEEAFAVTGHTHTADCYTQVLTCGMEEHAHTINCMTDETADLETEKDWEATLPGEEELTGNWNEDIVSIAESQLGYTESERNFRLADDGVTRNGYTRYGAWYGNEYGAWDAMFAAFCLYYAGVTEDCLPYNAGAYAWTVELEGLAGEDANDGPVYVSAGDYMPSAGDLVFLDRDGDGRADTVAIAAEVLENRNDEVVSLKLVQGDYEDTVTEYTAALDDGAIAGFGVIPEQPAAGQSSEDEIFPAGGEDGDEIDPAGAAGAASVTGDGLAAGAPGTASEENGASEETDGVGGEASEEASGEAGGGSADSGAGDAASDELAEEASGEASNEAPEETELTTLTYEGENYTISVTYGPEAELPDGTELTVYEYDPDSDRYQARYAEAAELYGWDEEPEEAGEDGSAGEDAGGNSVRLFNIGLYVMDGDGDMTEVEPAASVEVTITYHGLEERSYCAVAHFGGDAVEDVEASSAFEDGEETLAFQLDSFSDIMIISITAQYTSIVLNLGNGNGNASQYSYTGTTDSAMRYTISLSGCDPDQSGGTKITIILPGDGDLGSPFTVASGASAVTPTKNSTNYEYKLVGWYNIGDGQYVDVSSGSSQVTIDLNNINVFYADWEAKDYEDTSEGGTLRSDIVSTKNFVTIEMYDLNELLNLYGSYANINYTTSRNTTTVTETWYAARYQYTTPFNASVDGSSYSSNLGTRTGSTSASDLVTVKDHTTSPYNGSDCYGSSSSTNILSFLFRDNKLNSSSYQGSMLYFAGGYGAQGAWNRNWSQAMGTSDDNAHPQDATAAWGITSPTSYILTWLFNDDTVGSHYIGSADNLFWIEDGKYHFDAKEATAVYDQSEGSFHVYNAIRDVATDQNASAYFLPYNDLGTLDNGDGSCNYWFGMTMEVDFYLPYDTGNNDLKIDGEDMTFMFAGDDDIMIFIDDVLVLDASGTKASTTCTIDFTKGSLSMVGTSTNDNVNEGDTTISLKAGNHNLKVYYLERGADESNLAIEFNLAPQWYFETGDVETVETEKVWQDPNGQVIKDTSLYDLPDITVALYEKLTSEAAAEAGGEHTVRDVAVVTQDYTYTIKYRTGNSGSYSSTLGTYDYAGASSYISGLTEEPAASEVVAQSYVYMYTNGEGTDADTWQVVYTPAYSYELTTTDITCSCTRSGNAWSGYSYSLTGGTSVGSATSQTIDVPETVVIYKNGDVVTDEGELEAGASFLVDENGDVWVLVNTRTLNEADDWTWDWGLFEGTGGEFMVVELAGSGYKYVGTVSETEDVGYPVWTIIGEDELELGSGGTEGPMILTDAAQHLDVEAGVGEAKGYVLAVEENNGGYSIAAKEVYFSQHATFETVTDAEGEVMYYWSECGFCSAEDIAALGAGTLWYFEPVSDGSGGYVTISDSHGRTIHVYHVYCQLEENGQKLYLTIHSEDTGSGTEYTLGLTEKPDESFYYDSLGELIGYSDANPTASVIYRITIKINGETEVEVIQSGDAPSADEVRIYTLDEEFTMPRTIFTHTNQLYPDVTIRKVDSSGNITLAGASFKLGQVQDYSAGTSAGDYEYLWYRYTSGEDDPDASRGTSWVEDGDEATVITTGEDGLAVFHYLEDGVYCLWETGAPEGYTKLFETIFFTIDGGVMTGVQVDGSAVTSQDGTTDSSVVTSWDGSDLTITVANAPSVELPSTGGIGYAVFAAAGLAVTAAAAGLLAFKSRKGKRGEGQTPRMTGKRSTKKTVRGLPNSHF